MMKRLTMILALCVFGSSQVMAANQASAVPAAPAGLSSYMPASVTALFNGTLLDGTLGARLATFIQDPGVRKCGVIGVSAAAILYMLHRMYKKHTDSSDRGAKSLEAIKKAGDDALNRVAEVGATVAQRVNQFVAPAAPNYRNWAYHRVENARSKCSRGVCSTR